MMLETITKANELTDPQLVELCRRGDENAFGQLSQRHWRRCVDLGCYFLRNRVDSEDSVQNAFLKPTNTSTNIVAKPNSRRGWAESCPMNV